MRAREFIDNSGTSDGEQGGRPVAHKRVGAELINYPQQSQHQLLTASDDDTVTSVTTRFFGWRSVSAQKGDDASREIEA